MACLGERPTIQVFLSQANPVIDLPLAAMALDLPAHSQGFGVFRIDLQHLLYLLQSERMLLLLQPDPRAFEQLPDGALSARLIDLQAEHGHAGIHVPLGFQLSQYIVRKLRVTVVERLRGALHARL